MKKTPALLRWRRLGAVVLASSSTLLVAHCGPPDGAAPAETADVAVTGTEQALSAAGASGMFATDDAVTEQALSLMESTDLLAYYESIAAECTGPNQPSCKGQIIRTSYVQGPKWGKNNPAGVPLGCTINCRPFPGDPGRDAPTTLFPVEQAQAVIYRDTGIYTTRVTARDGFFRPTQTSEYQSYYRAGTLISNAPVRTVTREYQNMFGLPIPGDPEGNKYHLFSLDKSETIPGIGTIATTYLPTGEISTISRYGIVTGFTYDAQGNGATIWDMENGVRRTAKTYSDYKCGAPQVTTTASGYRHVVRYNDNCQIVSETPQNGRTITYELDGSFRLKTITVPGQLPIQFEYPNLNTTVRTRGSERVTVRADALGRQIGTELQDLTNPSSKIIKELGYDGDGRLTFSNQPGSWPAGQYDGEFGYDVLDRPRWLATRQTGEVITFAHSSPDTETVVSSNGEKTTTAYRTFGDPGSRTSLRSDVELSSGRVVTTETNRDIVGKLLSVKQDGVTETLEYDAQQFLRRRVSPSRGGVTYTRNPGSPLIVSQKEDGSVNSQYFTYDAAGRLELARSGTSASDTQSPALRYTYDANGDLASVTEPNGAERSFVYNLDGRKTREILKIDGYAFTLDFTYDQAGVLATTTYPDAGGFGGIPAGVRTVAKYTTDGLSRVTGITADNEVILRAVQYSPRSGQPQKLTFGNDVVEQTVEDAAFRVGSVAVVSKGQAAVALHYSYDASGHISRAEDLVRPERSEEFQYDRAGRLTFSSRNGAIEYTNGGDITKYKEVGQSTTTSMTYDAATKRLKSATGPFNRTYTTNALGEIESDGIRQFIYQRGTLMSVRNKATGASIAEYRYDGAGLRVKKVLGNGATTYYVYDTNRLIFEASPTQGTREYFYLGDRLVALRTRTGTTGTNIGYLHADAKRSIIAASDVKGAVFTNRVFNPYGSQWFPSPDFNAAVPPSFAGQMLDTETGLLYMNARYYDPQIGRFLTPDPVEFHSGNFQTFNAYAYANNNPVSFYDPSGAEGEPVKEGFFESLGNLVVDIVSDTPSNFRQTVYEIEFSYNRFKRQSAGDNLLDFNDNVLNPLTPVLLGTNKLPGAVAITSFEVKAFFATRLLIQEAWAYGKWVELGYIRAEQFAANACAARALFHLGEKGAAGFLARYYQNAGATIEQVQEVLKRYGKVLVEEQHVRPEKFAEFAAQAAKDKADLFIAIYGAGSGHVTPMVGGVLIEGSASIAYQAANAQRIVLYSLQSLRPTRGPRLPPPKFFPPPPPSGN